MSEQEKLPVCKVCEHAPACTHAVPERMVCCTHSGCMCAGWDMPETMWRRLMARPRLAPEHVETLSALVKFIGTEHRWSAAIRAALAALGEELTAAHTGGTPGQTPTRRWGRGEP